MIIKIEKTLGLTKEQAISYIKGKEDLPQCIDIIINCDTITLTTGTSTDYHIFDFDSHKQ